MDAEQEWIDQTKRFLKAELKRQDVTYDELARSYVTESILAGRVLDRRFDFGFRLELMRKDLRLCVTEAEAAGAPMLVCALAKQLYELAHAHGSGHDDMTVVVKELEQAAGTTIARRVAVPLEEGTPS